MNKKNKKLLKIATGYLQKKDYINALKFFSIVYKEDSENIDAKAGILLSSLSRELQDEILSLNEFFNIAKTFDPKNSYDVLESLVESLELGVSTPQDGQEISFDDAVEHEDGITFADFKKLYLGSENPKTVLQNIFFSTKVIITRKKDFFEFINILIKNEYIDMALNYIDSASTVFPADEKIRELLKKIKAHQI